MHTDKIKLMSLKNKNCIYIAIAILLIAIAGFRPVGIDRDSQNYYNEIINYGNGSHSFTLLEREPMYFLIVSAVKPFGNFAPRLVFIIYAMISITVLFVAIKRIAKYPYISIFLYICLFYLLFNMTQMRASVAGSLYLYSLDDIKDKKFTNFTIKILIAVLFHYSAAIIFPFYFITTTDNVRQKLFYGFLPILGFILGSYNMVHLYNATVNYVGHSIEIIPGLSKLNGYFNTVQLQGVINPFNLYACSLLMILWIGLYIKTKDKNVLVALKMLGLSIFFCYAFRSVPVISHRFSQLISMPVIYIIPYVFLFIVTHFHLFIKRINFIQNKEINIKMWWHILIFVYGIYRLLIIIFKDKLLF